MVTVNEEDKLIILESGEVVPISCFLKDGEEVEDFNKADSFIAGPTKDGKWIPFGRPGLFHTKINN